MKHLSLFTLLLASTAVHGQVITKLSNGTSTFYYDVSELHTIITNASDNDTIVLPGGALFSPNIVINKPLTIIGAGVLQPGTPVTQTTQWTSTTPNQGTSPGFYIQSGGAGSSIHGIDFNSPVRFSGSGNNAPTFNAYFNRCSLRGGLYLSTFGTFSIWSACPANVTLKQCLITGINYGASSVPVSDFQLLNCFIAESVAITGGNAASSTLVDQCVILGSGTHSVNAGVVFNNNIFVKNSGTYNFSGSSATFTNNVFGTQSGGALPVFGVGGAFSNNVAATNTSIFQNVSDFTYFYPIFNYQLSNASPAAGVGQGGYDAGVHSGPPGNPWKADAIPFNPHWVSLSPSLGSTNGGTINVSFTGAAQEN